MFNRGGRREQKGKEGTSVRLKRTSRSTIKGCLKLFRSVQSKTKSGRRDSTGQRPL